MHKNDKQNLRKHLKMHRRMKRGKANVSCKWYRRQAAEEMVNTTRRGRSRRQ